MVITGDNSNNYFNCFFRFVQFVFLKLETSLPVVMVRKELVE